MRSFLVCWLIFVVSIYHVTGQDPEPIMTLNAFVSDISNVMSVCKNRLQYLINDVDNFTVRGTVNINGANADAYKDTTLYLQARAEPSTNGWASQCRPDLTVCGSNLTTDCYCESKDENGDYHLVMTIMAKSIYSGGKLMLAWNDARSPFNPPVLSNQVDYYPGTISDQVKLTLKNGSTELTLVTGQKVNPDIFTNDTAQLCLENLAGISSFEIKENGNPLAQTTTDSCLTLDFTEKSPSGEWTVSYTESGGCERTGSYTIYMTGGSDCGFEVYQIVFIVIVCGHWVALLVVLIIKRCRINRSDHGLEAYEIAVFVIVCTLCVDAGVVILIIICYHKFIKRLEDLEKVLIIVIVCCLWAGGAVFCIILICIKQTSKPDCGFEEYEIVFMCCLIVTGVNVLIVIVCFFKSKNNGNRGSSSQELEKSGTRTTNPNASTRI